MSNQAGWVSVWRQELENPIITKSPEHFTVWHLLLLLATSRPRRKLFKGKEIVLEPGQLIITRQELTQIVQGMNISKVRRVLEDFEKNGQIVQVQSNKNRLITIVNWNKYQKNGTQKTDKKTRNNAENNEEKNIDGTQLAHNWHTDGTQMAHRNTNIYNNINNNNKVNKVNKPSVVKKSDLPKKPTLDEIKAYCNQQNLTIDCERFYDYYSRYGWQMKGEPLDWKEVAESWNRTEYRKPKKENKLSVSRSYDIDEWEDYSMF